MKNRSSRVVAPDFTLSDQFGKAHSLRDYRGSWVVLYFYPEDDTPGCTTQACDIRDSWAVFKKKEVVVLGISPDSVESHHQFAKKYELPFTLLADPDKKVIELYETWQEKISLTRVFFGVERSTVIIDPEGKIAKVYKKVNADTHAQLILKDLEKLQHSTA